MTMVKTAHSNNSYEGNIQQIATNLEISSFNVVTLIQYTNNEEVNTKNKPVDK